MKMPEAKGSRVRHHENGAEACGGEDIKGTDEHGHMSGRNTCSLHTCSSSAASLQPSSTSARQRRSARAHHSEACRPANARALWRTLCHTCTGRVMMQEGTERSGGTTTARNSGKEANANEQQHDSLEDRSARTDAEMRSLHACVRHSVQEQPTQR